MNLQNARIYKYNEFQTLHKCESNELKTCLNRTAVNSKSCISIKLMISQNRLNSHSMNLQNDPRTIC